MANLYADSVLGDVVQVASTAGGYYEMVIVNKKSPDEVWLVDKSGQGTDVWTNKQAKCNAFKNVLVKSVRDSVTGTRLLAKDEIAGSYGDRLTFFLSSAYDHVKVFGASGKTWWTDTTVPTNSSMAYATYGLNGGVAYPKTKKYEIHPMIILNGSQDIEGVTFPPKKIPVPTISKISFSYDEIPCEPDIDYKGNEDKITTGKSYSGKQSAVGTYEITFTLKDTSKYNWSNNPKGATAAATLTWEIKAPAVIPITTVPRPNKTLIYNGSEQTMTFDGYDPTKMTISGNTGTNAEIYTAIITPKTGYSWSDGTTGGKSVSWKIVKKSVDIPVASGSTTHYYDGSAYFPSINYGNTDNQKWYTITGDKTAISSVGDYSVTFVLNDKNNCQWSDNTITDKSINWCISKRTITIPEISPLSFVYNGEEQSPRISIKSGEEKYITISGTTAAIDVNPDGYVLTLSLRDPSGCVWSDGRTEPRSITWYITPKRIDVIPSQKGTLIYNGSPQSPEWDNYDNTELSIGGTTSGVDAGSYPATFTPKSGHCWGDGSVDPIEVEWVIHRSPTAVPPVIGDSVFQYNGRAQSPTWVFFDAERIEIISGGSGVNAHKYETLVRPIINYCWGDGSFDEVPYEWEITRKPLLSDPTYEGELVFEYNGKEISPKWVNYPQDFVIGTGLSARATGEYKAKFFVDENHCWADGTYEPIEIIWMITVDMSKVSPYDIARDIERGIHDKIWKIGDRVPVKLDGIIGGVRFKNAWFYAYIIGFDHNNEIEGGGRSIHFQFAKLSDDNKEVAFTDKNYGKSAGKGFCMNITDTANGGWCDSYMRNTICRQFYEALPQTWRDYIISCPKYTENSDNSVTMTKDKIFLLSEYECTGKGTSANYQKQYDYYKENGYTGKGQYNAPNEAVKCWLRSTCSDDEGKFRASSYTYYDTSGKCSSENASTSYGFAPCFVIGELGMASAGGDFYDDDDPNKPTPVLKRVHIPQQVEPSFEDGTKKTPKWDEYNDTAINAVGGEWDGISAGTYNVMLELKPGYIWEDDTLEIKAVPWMILRKGERVPKEPAPIKVHIPEQINPPHFDRFGKVPEWDDWNKLAIRVVGGTLKEYFAAQYMVKVELKPHYIWENNTTGIKILPWVILPRGSVIDNSNSVSEDKDLEVIVQSRPKPKPNKHYDPDDPNVDTEDNISNVSQEEQGCCYCDPCLFNMLNNRDCDDDAGCDCTSQI